MRIRFADRRAYGRSAQLARLSRTRVVQIAQCFGRQGVRTNKHIQVICAGRRIRWRASGRLELLPEGYDAQSMIYTTAGGPEIEDPEASDSKKFLDVIFEEFCFLKDDRERAISVAISAMLTLFVSHIIPRGAQRPGFLYTANSEGAGKTLLARVAIIPRIGLTPTGSLPEQEEEIQKRVFAAAIAGSPVLFLDNGKRHVSSGALESALTAPSIEGRILGKSQMISVENMMTVFLTGNGSTISPDLRRRVLHVDLFLREVKAEYREIKRPLDESTIRDMRPEILSALWVSPLTGTELEDYCRNSK